MNKKYAIEILEMVERNILKSDNPLSKEAFRYLKNLKKIDEDTYNRIYKIQYK